MLPSDRWRYAPFIDQGSQAKQRARWNCECGSFDLTKAATSPGVTSWAILQARAFMNLRTQGGYMKHQSTAKWTLGPATEGLLFTAQRMQEMLFHYTYEPFLCPLSNTRTLCNEARSVLADVRAKRCSDAVLRPILGELRHSLMRDSVARAIVGPTIADYQSILGSDPLSGGKRELARALSTLGELLSGERRYFDTAVEQLQDAVADPKKKLLANRLVQQAVTDLHSRGYSRDYIYYRTIEFFFNSTRHPKTIAGPSVLSDFFGSFDFKRKSYKVLLFGSSEFAEMKSTCERFGVRVQSSFTKRTNRIEEANFLKSRGRNQVFLVVDVPDGPYSPQDARAWAEVTLSRLSNLFSFTHHSARPRWSDSALVYSESSYVLLLEHNPERIRKRGDTALSQVDPKLEDTMSAFLRLEMDSSFPRFLSALDLHGAAVESATPENRLLDLWALIESVVPLDRTKGSRIRQVVNLMMPLLRNSYTHELLTSTLADTLYPWSKTATNTALHSVSSKIGVRTLAELLALPTHQPALSALYGKMDTAPLARFRLHSLWDSFGSGASVSRSLDAYCRHAEWQLYRIYRARNSIIHAGKAPARIDLLVHTLHSYADVLTEHMQAYVTSGRSMTRIDNMFADSARMDSWRTEKAKAAGTSPLNDSNWLEVVLGGSHLLALYE